MPVSLAKRSVTRGPRYAIIHTDALKHATEMLRSEAESLSLTRGILAAQLDGLVAWLEEMGQGEGWRSLTSE